jgi:N-acetylglucosamine kinase-like BadF-type ATPase
MAEKNDKQRKAVKRIKKAVRKAVAKGVPVRDISQTVGTLLSEPAKSKKAAKPEKAAKKAKSSKK